MKRASNEENMAEGSSRYEQEGADASSTVAEPPSSHAPPEVERVPDASEVPIPEEEGEELLFCEEAKVCEVLLDLYDTDISESHMCSRGVRGRVFPSGSEAQG